MDILHHCIVCNFKTDSFVSLNEKRTIPRRGDVCICPKCGHVALYDYTKDGQLFIRECENKDLEEIESDIDLMQSIQEVVKTIKKVLGGVN